jgi:predicted nucleic acid-binding protein
VTTFVDTSVLLDLLDDQSAHYAWSAAEFVKAKAVGPVVVSDVVYTEFSVTLPIEEEADAVISRLALVRCGYPNQALFRAGKAYAQYRRNRGTKLNVLPDFFVGALADVEGAPVLTRDPAKVQTYFPQVQVISP